MVSDDITVGKFVDGLQSDINKLWKSSQGSQELEYSLPKKIEWVCFVDLLEPGRGTYSNRGFYEEFERYPPERNLFFHPIDSAGLNSFEIEHIDFEGDNPLCFENVKGKVKITIEKDFGEALVSITT